MQEMNAVRRRQDALPSQGATRPGLPNNSPAYQTILMYGRVQNGRDCAEFTVSVNSRNLPRIPVVENGFEAGISGQKKRKKKRAEDLPAFGARDSVPGFMCFLLTFRK